MLEWLYLIQLGDLPGNYIPQESPLQTPFTKARRNVLLRRTPASLRCKAVALLHRSRMIFGKL